MLHPGFRVIITRIVYARRKWAQEALDKLEAARQAMVSVDSPEGVVKENPSHTRPDVEQGDSTQMAAGACSIDCKK